LKRLAVRTVLVVGDRDKAVPPGDARKVAALIPQASVERLSGLGHLAHEEDPAQVARLIVAHAARAGVLAAP
jgi:magnesium chelatase accessory protein